MKINQLFKKDINRNIETVIKADDRQHISDEVAEYVVTNEIRNKINSLFSAYNNPVTANGVWISGFFGSGKSHLLKILSYVLENKQFNGYKSGELFAEKIEDDQILKNDILAASRIPSESILFNIDQQAQITTKSDPNAILSVFYKVFYDHMGYYGFQPHVAEFEMWIDKQQQYAEFKTKFNEAFGKPWEKARIDYFDPIVTDTAADVLAELNGKDSKQYMDILDRMEDQQKQSIEDFCERVNNYIKSKEKGFRLNFFVDEVGQYISDNTKLMLNLQTIAETLATRTKGKSWILVTSQEDMEQVVGDMSKSQKNDFSRIQARFSIKVPLSSANVDEVIEKRLLKKKTESQEQLIECFENQASHLGSLISFSETGIQFKGYENDVDFANKYPFTPYQFDLFQQARRDLSNHNAFQGKHASVGERSMLGVFQQVIQQVKEEDSNALVSFDRMYEGIRNELRGEIQSAVIMAEKNLENKFAIKVLKALFLVKYYKSFKTTKRNISVLMIDKINIDLDAHNKNIEQALNTLENQSYIQRNGELYEFLTNDEKDVEQEIKNTEIDEQAETSLMKAIFFDSLIGDNKIKYDDNKQFYSFTNKLDGITLGQEKELCIEIITENNADYGNENMHKAHTMGSTTMKLRLASNAIMMKDIKMFLRTQKYIKQNQSTNNRPELKRILQEKGELNGERKKNIEIRANQTLAEASIFMNGSELPARQSSDGKTRVINAFQDLVKVVYSNLRMLGSTLITEQTVKATINSKQDDLFGTSELMVAEAEAELLNLISRRKKQSDLTYLADIKTHFTNKPYGWYPNGIWNTVATLFRQGKIELKQNTNTLEADQTLVALLNSANHKTTLVEPMAVVDPKQLKALKELYKEAFDESCPYREPRDVANAFKDKLKDMQHEVANLLNNNKDFPFVETLQPFKQKLVVWCGKEYSFFLENATIVEEELLDAKEDLFDPIKRFMKGDQFHIYESIRKMMEGDTSNLNYIEGEESKALQALLQNKTPYKGSAIRDAKKAKDTLSAKVMERIQEEKESAVQSIEQAIEKLKDKEEFGKLTEPQQQSIVKPLQQMLGKASSSNYISYIRDTKAQVADKMLTDQLNQMIRLATPPKPVQNDQKGEVKQEVKGVEKGDAKEDKKQCAEPVIQYIKQGSVKANYTKSELRTESDVDEYIESLRTALKDQIKNNRRIEL